MSMVRRLLSTSAEPFFISSAAVMGVGNDFEADVLEGGADGVGPVGGVAVEEDFFVLELGDEAEGAGADGVNAFVAGGAGFDDAEEAVGEVEEQAGERGAGVDDEGEGVGGVEVGDVGEGSALGGDEGAVGHAADGPGDVGGGEWVVVVEADVGAEVEDPGEGGGALPTGGEPGLEVEVFIFSD